ncbi:MAG: hypothetical protein KIT31_07925 [Deltaproteobacteria bacterium]|nr:hypothetical protein [Deltaproteobacteria bacterium]
MWRPMRLVPVVALTVGCGGGSGKDPDGPISEPAAISLTLRDPGGASSSNAAFVAVRDGDGAWTEVTGTGGVYSARVMSNRYGWWIGCVRASGTGRNAIVYRHLDDGVDLEARSCAVRTLPLTISGAITGIPETDSAEVYSLWTFDAPSDAAYSVGTEVGPAQILASRLDDDFRGVSVIRADLGTLAADATRDLAFAQEAQPFARLPLALPGLRPGELVETFSGVYVGDGAMYLPFESPSETAELLALPPAMRLPGDMFDATASTTLQNGALAERRSIGTFAATLPTTLTLPAPRSFGDATVTAAPFSIGWKLPALTADAQLDALWISTSRTQRLMITSVAATPRWSAASTTIDVTEVAAIPDALAQSPGDTFTWSIEEVIGAFAPGGSIATSGTQGTVGSALQARLPSRAELRTLHETRLALRRPIRFR